MKSVNILIHKKSIVPEWRKLSSLVEIKLVKRVNWGKSVQDTKTLGKKKINRKEEEMPNICICASIMRGPKINPKIMVGLDQVNIMQIQAIHTSLSFPRNRVPSIWQWCNNETKCTWIKERIRMMLYIGKEPTCQGRRHKRPGLDPWVGKIPWKRACQPTAVILPGKSHGQRSLAGYSP